MGLLLHLSVDSMQYGDNRRGILSIESQLGPVHHPAKGSDSWCGSRGNHPNEFLQTIAGSPSHLIRPLGRRSISVSTHLADPSQDVLDAKQQNRPSSDFLVRECPPSLLRFCRLLRRRNPSGIQIRLQPSTEQDAHHKIILHPPTTTSSFHCVCQNGK